MVAVGVMVMLPPRTPPSLSMKSYESLLVLQLRVTDVPEETVVDEAVKLLMEGAEPVGAEFASQPG